MDKGGGIFSQKLLRVLISDGRRNKMKALDRGFPYPQYQNATNMHLS